MQTLKYVTLWSECTGDVEKRSSVTHHHLVALCDAVDVVVLPFVYYFCIGCFSLSWLLAFTPQKVGGGGHRDLLQAQVKRIDNCSSEENTAQKYFMLRKYD